jgi:hypothetical protein
MGLILHNSIVTMYNVIKGGWIGDTKCRFCDKEKDIHFLFFLCRAARYMWSVVSINLGANDRLGNFTEYFHLKSHFASSLTNVNLVGVAALC